MKRNFILSLVLATTLTVPAIAGDICNCNCCCTKCNCQNTNSTVSTTKESKFKLFPIHFKKQTVEKNIQTVETRQDEYAINDLMPDGPAEDWLVPDVKVPQTPNTETKTQIDYPISDMMPDLDKTIVIPLDEALKNSKPNCAKKEDNQRQDEYAIDNLMPDGPAEDWLVPEAKTPQKNQGDYAIDDLLPREKRMIIRVDQIPQRSGK